MALSNFQFNENCSSFCPYFLHTGVSMEIHINFDMRRHNSALNCAFKRNHAFKKLEKLVFKIM